MKEINLEEIFKKACEQDGINKPNVLKAMKEAIKQALELAAEKVTIQEITDSGNLYESDRFYTDEASYIINKDSITNVLNYVK